MIFEIRLADSSTADSSTLDSFPFRSHLFPMKGKNHYMITQQTSKALKTYHVHYSVLRAHETAPLQKRIIYPRRGFLYALPEKNAVEEICAKILASRNKRKLPYAVFLGRNPHLEEEAFFLDSPGGKRQYQWRLVDDRKAEKSLASTFPKLLRRIRDPDTKFVLSFGAGGLRLFAHPSMMKFINAIGARPNVDEIWGCSGGALAGLAYAMGAPPELFEQRGYDIYNRRFRLTLTPSIFRIWKNLIFDRFLPASPNLLRGFVSAHQSLQVLLNDFPQHRKIEIPFFCVAYNVKRERNQILTPLPGKKLHCYDDLIIHADPREAVAASCSLPILYIPKVIRGGKGDEQYVDGATIEEVPLASIYRKWRIDRKLGIEKRSKLMILAVDLFPRIGQQWLDLPILNKFPFVDLIHFGLELIDLVRRARIQDQTEPLRLDPHVEVLKITLPLKTLSVLNPRHIPKIIHSAQTSFLEQMTEIEGEL